MCESQKKSSNIYKDSEFISIKKSFNSYTLMDEIHSHYTLWFSKPANFYKNFMAFRNKVKHNKSHFQKKKLKIHFSLLTVSETAKRK